MTEHRVCVCVLRCAHAWGMCIVRFVYFRLNRSSQTRKSKFWCGDGGGIRVASFIQYRDAVSAYCLLLLWLFVEKHNYRHSLITQWKQHIAHIHNMVFAVMPGAPIVNIVCPPLLLACARIQICRRIYTSSYCRKTSQEIPTQRHDNDAGRAF